eukprot:5995924-Pyramimonas_sp.AAC.1
MKEEEEEEKEEDEEGEGDFSPPSSRRRKQKPGRGRREDARGTVRGRMSKSGYTFWSSPVVHSLVCGFVCCVLARFG